MRVLRVLLGLLIVLIAFGCKLPGMTPEDRVDQFLRDVASNRGSIYTNIHPDVSWYNQAKSESTWSLFPADGTYTMNTVNGSTVTVTETGLGTIIFNLRVDTSSTAADDYKIYDISAAGWPY